MDARHTSASSIVCAISRDEELDVCQCFKAPAEENDIDILGDCQQVCKV